MEKQYQPRLSIVIPTRNEEKQLPSLLNQLKKQQNIELEIIISDGESSDTTVQLAKQAGATAITTRVGRGHQMNQGAKVASNKYILFLHADSEFSDTHQLSKALKQLTDKQSELATSKVAGHFSLRFKRNNTDIKAYKFYEAKTRLNRANTTNGDQGFLMSTDYFKELGGFSEDFHFLEDQKLAERIRKDGTWITFDSTISTSTRRFEQEGFARRMILSAMIMGLYSISLDEFFDKAPQVYKEHQTKQTKLNLPPLCKLIHECLWQHGIYQGLKNWLGIGEFVKNNAWQLFFLLDYQKNIKEHKYIKIHDQYFEPITRNCIFYAIAMALTMLWFYGTWTYFQLVALKPAVEHTMTLTNQKK